MIPGLQAFAGAAILFFGRKIYWFTIAAVGFFAALELTSRLFQDQAAWLSIVLALLAGLIGAALAVRIQRLAIGLVGLLLGGFFMLQLTHLFELQLTGWNWLIIIAGGLLGMVLLSALFEWTLILLTTLIGTMLITQSALAPGTSRLLVFSLCLLLGISVQIYFLVAEKRARPN
jgi:hypothetical protein